MVRKRSKALTERMMVRRSVEIEPRRVVRVGRNEACPCGSGRKYKDCHEREGEAFIQRLARQQEKERRLEEQKRAGVPWYKRLLTLLRG